MVAYIDQCLSCEVPLGTTVQRGSGGSVDLAAAWIWCRRGLGGLAAWSSDGAQPRLR